jgi:glycine/D-amino acid oxidase-like deaminating enzyme
MGYLIILGAGAILAATSYLLLKREQRRGRQRVAILARLARYHTAEAGGRAAGYYPGSKVDPRD